MNQIPAKVSRNRLSRPEQDDNTPVDPAQMARMSDVAISVYRKGANTKEDFVNEISVLWTQAQHRFLEIGNWLILAKEKLAEGGGYEKMIANDLPFQRSVAHALRSVAEAVNKKRLGRDELPNSYSTAYLLTSLPADGLAEARKRRLIHPDVRRAQVAEFCREFRMRNRPNQPPLRQRLLREREALEEQRRRIDERLAQITTDLRASGYSDSPTHGKLRGSGVRVIDGVASEEKASQESGSSRTTG